MKFVYSKTFFWFAISVAVLAGLFFLQTRGYLAYLEYGILQAPRPLVGLLKTGLRPVNGFFSNLWSLKTIVSENAQLRDQVNELQQKLVDYHSLLRDNETLRSELGFAKTAPFQLKPCSVLSVDPQGLSDTVIINCGEKDGVREGQAVISQGHLVAKILYVGQLTSTAILITNPQTSIDARLADSETTGVVKGSFGSGLFIDLVSQNSLLPKGSLVVTAGINSKIPKNIVIGEIADLLSQPNDLLKKATVISPIKFRQLSFVFIVE